MPKGIWKNGLKPKPPSRKGVKLSQEHLDSLKKAITGNTWNRGRKHSEDSTELKRKNSAKHWLGKTGKDHPHWKDSKQNPLYTQIRQCFQYREWRKEIYIRDTFTCVLCGRNKEVSGQLEADHFPKQFIDILAENQIQSLEEAVACEELWNVNNGRTLCRLCHNPTRGKRGKKQWIIAST